MSMASETNNYGNFSIRNWVSQRFTPVIMVVTSERAEKECERISGMNLIDLLSPVSHIKNLNIPINIGNRNIRIQDMKLRLYYANNIRQLTAEALDSYLKQIIDICIKKDIKIAPKTLKECIEYSVKSNQKNLSPWFEHYRDGLLSNMTFDSHETFDHPIGCIFAISAEEEDSVGIFEYFKKNSLMPILMSQGYMYPIESEDFAKFFLLIKEHNHNCISPKDNLRTVQKIYGHNNCSELILHSENSYHHISTSDLNNISEDISKEYKNIKKINNEKIEKVLRNFVIGCLIPQLDARISRMMYTMPTKRKGIAGKFMDRTQAYLKSSWMSMPKDHVTMMGFKHYTEEAQARQMGDILFMLKIYDQAIDVYHSLLVSKEQYPKFYAGLQEMIALSHVMISSDVDPSKYFMRAFDHYMRVPGKMSKMLVTKVALIHASYLNSVGKHDEANDVLIRGYENEDTLRGALILEQAAFSLLMKKENVPWRRFAFEMTLAGLWYDNCLIKDLSLRCYTLIQDLYKGRDWDSLEKHINETILRHAIERNDVISAIDWILDMLSKTSNIFSLDIARHYLPWVCNHLKNNSSEHKLASIENLCIPQINTDEIKFLNYHTNDDNNSTNDGDMKNSFSSLQQQQQKVLVVNKNSSYTWKEIEKKFEDQNIDNNGYNNGYNNNSIMLNNQLYSICICEENIQLSLTITNPLSTDILVSKLKLNYEFESNDNDSMDSVQVFENSFGMVAKESMNITLALKPLKTGLIHIKSISWILNDIIPGHILFEKDRTTSTSNRLPLRASALKMKFRYKVMPLQPRLKIASKVLPIELWKGEIWHGIWELKNINNIPINEILIATSSSSDIQFYKIIEDNDKIKEEKGFGKIESIEIKNNVFKFKMDTPLTCSYGIKIGICIHPSKVGCLNALCIFRYKSIDKWYMLRTAFSICINPSIDFDCEIRPSSTSLAPYLLITKIKNRYLSKSATLKNISCISDHWKIIASSNHDKNDNILNHNINALSDVTLTFLLKNQVKDIKNGDFSGNNCDDKYISFIKKAKLNEMMIMICLEWYVSSNEIIECGMHCINADLSTIFKPIDISLELTHHEISHDFINDSICSIPIKLNIKNIASFPVSLSMLLDNDKTYSTTNTIEKGEGVWNMKKLKSIDDSSSNEIINAGIYGSNKYHLWNGLSEINVKEMNSGCHKIYDLDIIVFKPGLYEISDYLCSWSSDAKYGNRKGFVSGKKIFINVNQICHS